MKPFILLTLVVLATATVYAEDETSMPTTSSMPVTKEWITRTPLPPYLRIRFYTDLQEASQTETYQFNIAIAYVKELREEDVTIYRQNWSRGNRLVKPKFNITWKTFDREEFKLWWQENKTGGVGQTKPFPNEDFKYAIVGDANIDNVTCEDHHGVYEIYVKKVRFWPHYFRLKVKGCPKRG